jgi:hypothetical protein
MSATAEWASTAAKVRFGPKASIEDLGETVAPHLSARYAIFLDNVLLGTGATWEAAFQDAVNRNPDLPQPSPVDFQRPAAPEGEEFIEEFVRAMHQRDLLSEFLIWYGERHDKEPEDYPMALHREEWFDTLGNFLQTVE